jgi:hypothetical protein
MGWGLEENIKVELISHPLPNQPVVSIGAFIFLRNDDLLEWALLLRTSAVVKTWPAIELRLKEKENS